MKTFNLSHSDFKTNIGEGLDMILDFFANSAMNSGELAIGSSSKAKVKVVKDLHFQVNGVMKMIAAATEVAFTATTDDVAAGKEKTFLLVSDGSTTKLVGGVQAAVGASVDPSEAAIAGFTVLGRVKVANGSASLFDATTTLLDATDITATYTNIGLYAPRFSDIM
ncbi:MAG: hypothetical protein RBT33_03885 [Candidatus Dojkabacteria bacterium]|jgi:hypothetical protein|nr:hypothetical protein [Candidatus Dojkabacteria bacterium]